MQTSDLNVNNAESDRATAIFRQYQDAIFSRERTSVKTSTKIIFDLLSYSGKKLQRCHCQKKSCHRFFYLNNISRVFLPWSQWHCPK